MQSRGETSIDSVAKSIENMNRYKQAESASPKRSAGDYLEWMNQHIPEFTDNQRHTPNNGARLCMFTVASQHVYGDSVEECIDNAQIAIAATSFMNPCKLPVDWEQ